MKRLTEEQIEYSLTRARKMARREARKQSGGRRMLLPMRVFSRVRIPAPSALDLFNPENYKLFIEFITLIRDFINDGEKVLIDFRNTNAIKACAVIVLYAYIDFLQRQTKDKTVIAITTCGSARVNNWFKICGIWGITGFQRVTADKLNSMEIVSAVAGKTKNNQESAEAREKIKNVLKYIKGTIYEGKISVSDGQKLYAALTESISNVGLHAYSNETQFSEFIADIGKRWWILAHKVEEQLYLMVYDMGEGIPVTLVKKDFFTLIAQIFNPKTDSDKIYAAVQYGETRMNSQKHGKGLPDMKRYVVDNPEGQLHIFSGMGRYSYNAANNAEEQFDLPYSIGGTLIQWNVSLRGTE
ncbi:hypothetical protein [Klebsiella pneumoniae]|uniref:hypothetical protein n=1 Tax=Klebsiella pneumoniae TaxID=573 RepID=UPI000460DEC9|nr:hypothetical protein [Klebsiella pneumoniae]EIV2149511.1 hypothetical protein [Klebsiella pneumoniae]EIV6985555.1 hypothetical protein [Klebsiella pneumoniae]EJM8618058.1 hypothetical protein [Klebsiella pneumoniae]EJM9289497.1 hypothetical protein [Klebsiella pneumoniae]EJP5749615.1 hypothetical protein [Klebsiella pneumoniae]